MQKVNKYKKKFVNFQLKMTKSGKKRAKILKEKQVFYKFGENNEWHPSKVPSNSELISIHNNVVVAAHVYFCTHDLISTVFNNQVNSKKYKIFLGTIEVFDNVFIGANSTIMYNTKIGPNAIVAAGSVVTKDVPEGSIVGGNPAKIIGQVNDLKQKRLIYQDTMKVFNSSMNDSQLIDYLWRNGNEK